MNKPYFCNEPTVGKRMRHHLFIISLLISATGFAQERNTRQCDVILLTSNDSLYCTIVEMTKRDITYKGCGSDSTKSNIISRSEVLTIRRPDNSYVVINTRAPIPINPPVKKIETVSCDTVIGQFTFTIGLGNSPGFNQTGVFYGEFYAYPVATAYNSYHESGVTSYSKEICGAFDYRIKKRISLGLTMSYQTENVDQGYAISAADKISRLNMAARILGYTKTYNRAVISYMGLRVGCSFWNDDCSKSGDWYIKSSSLIVPSFQVLFGVTMFPVSFLGLNLEGGLGSPYLAEAGLTYRFSNKKKI
jgi:hypothetical protein